MIGVIVQKLLRRLASQLPGNWLRRAIYSMGGVVIGSNVNIARGVRISNNVIIGADVKIRESVRIGSNVQIGDGVTVSPRAIIGNNVQIGKEVFISSNAVIGNTIIGDYSFIEYGVICTGYQNGQIKIGKYTYIGIYTVLDWSGGLEIGDYVMIAGPSVGIWTHSGALMPLLNYKHADHSHKKALPVRIESNTYIGGNSSIYPGVTIHHHSIILPNSAVNKVILPYTMAGGCPAVPKKRIQINQESVSFQSLPE